MYLLAYYFYSELGSIKDIESKLLLLDTLNGPSEEYEDLRRRVYSNIKELWYYINYESPNNEVTNRKR